MTLVSVACCSRTPATCAAAVWLARVTFPTFAFSHATSSVMFCAGIVFLARRSSGFRVSRPIGSEVLLQIVGQRVNRAVADMRVPLTEIDRVAVGRRARDSPHADAAAGAADV